jgi:hypothetical protein
MNYRMILVGAVVALTAACHSRPIVERAPQSQPVSVPASGADLTPTSRPPEDLTPEQSLPSADAVNTIPPCLPEVAKPKITVRRRPRPSQETEKPASMESQAPRVSSSGPEVKPVEASVASILGKKVQGAEGEDLGRVVDVQADGGGRVRLVIIEFGGFLGVGNRRAAVDWSLLRFHPDDPEQPLSLSVSAKQVQGTPEYRQASHPRALMAPAPAPAPAAAPSAEPAPGLPANPSPPQTQ